MMHRNNTSKVMDKWPDRPNGEVPCLPKKSLLCRNWKSVSFDSSQDSWNDRQNSFDPGKCNSENSSVNNDFSNRNRSHIYSMKNNENDGQASNAFSPYQSSDDESNYRFLTQIDWTHSGLSPLNLFVPSDTSSESSSSLANSFLSNSTSAPFCTNSNGGATPHSQSENNKKFNSVWLQPTQNVDKNDKISNETYTWDKNVKQDSGNECMQSSPLLPKETETVKELEFVNNNMASNKMSVFQTKYGLGDLSLYSIDEMDKKSKEIDYEDKTGKRDDKFTVIADFPLQKMDIDKQTESDKNRWPLEQSPWLSRSSEVLPSNSKKKLSQNSCLSKQNNSNLDMKTSKTKNGKTVSRNSSEIESIGVNDITSTSSPDFKVTGKDKKWLINHKECQVCGDRSAGFYCNAFICEACKKFFVRACKQEKLKYVCLRDKNCSITKESRVQCQFCRYQKCLQLKMFCTASGSMKKEDKNVSDIPCRVCSAPSSGFHFGALTCEGCKGFFRRMAKERESNKYHCSKGGFCEINSLTRNICKACRYKKCLEANMSIEASRIGRQPNAVKHAISLELQNRSGPDEKWGLDKINSSDHDTDFLMEIKQEPFSNENSVDCTEYKNNCTGLDDTSREKFCGVSKMENEYDNLKEKEFCEKTGNSNSMDVCSPGTGFTDNTKDRAESSSVMDDSLMEIVSKIEKANKELLQMVKRETTSYDEKNFQNVEICWKYMMKEFDHNALCTIRFAKKVFGFKTLTLDDQVKLIQSSIYPIVVLNFSRFFDKTTKAYRYFNFGTQERDGVFRLFPMLKILSSHFRHAGEMAHNLELDELEYGFLGTLLLYNPDVPDLNEAKKVTDLQEEIGYAIQCYEERKYNNGQTRYGLMLLRLAELHLFTVQHDFAIHSLIMKNPTIEVPQLYKEIILKWNQ